MTAVASPSSLASMMADVEAQLRAELEALDSQILASRRARGLTDDESYVLDEELKDMPLSEEDNEAQETVRQFLDMINRAADSFNESNSASIETFAVMQGQASEVLSALSDSQSQLPKRVASPTSTEIAANNSEVQQKATVEAPKPAAIVAAPTSAPETLTSEQALTTSPTKGGMLLNYGKERFMRSFQNHYVVISDGSNNTVAGLSWYDSEAAFKKGSSPVDSIPFFVTEKNSRGSLFKKAAVCWPLVTDEDCPKLSSADKNKTYFAVDYVAKSGKSDLVVLGAADEKERDEWVTFITRYVALYLPPGEEFEPFINFPVGANPPLHVSMVLGGEAPGSAQRVIDPTARR